MVGFGLQARRLAFSTTKSGDFAERGFSAAVYTQTTDVEIEVNGFMTYDRKVIKMEEDQVRKINRKVIATLAP